MALLAHLPGKLKDLFAYNNVSKVNFTEPSLSFGYFVDIFGTQIKPKQRRF